MGPPASPPFPPRQLPKCLRLVSVASPHSLVGDTGSPLTARLACRLGTLDMSTGHFSNDSTEKTLRNERVTILKGTCPYCRTTEVALSVTHRYDRPHDGGLHEAYALMSCGFCARASLGVFRRPNQSPLIDSRFLVDIFPTLDVAPPKHLPAEVKSRYMEAVKIMGMAPESAGMMFRKTLDVALKCIRPDDRGNLKQRIDKAAEGDAITKDLAEWAHRIRLDGNDAAHDDDPISPDEVNDLHRFTELVLLYLFSLPGMLDEWHTTKT